MVSPRSFFAVLLQTILMLLTLQALASADDSTDAVKPPPCMSDIYCHGELLHTVQMAHIYSDSKTFVDMKMKHPPNKTLSLFHEFMNQTDNMPTKNQIEKFVNETFDPEGSEFEDWDPKDWVQEPKFLDKIQDPKLKKFGSDLNHIWKLLGRKMKDEVKHSEELYSIIYVPNPVIVPGGRFREFYYWDSYWIIRGLLHSQMHDTVRGMLSNFVSIVDKIGFIPNGGRVYYTMRSQPPLLTPMVKDYVETTGDQEWLKENLWLLEKEFDFWMTNHTINIKKDGVNYTLARYFEESSGPRPESYREDVESAQYFRTEGEKQDHYAELKTAAESGWDFSSRWFIHESTKKGNLTDLKARYIIPVDLNAIIYWNAELLAEFNTLLGNTTKAAEYSKKAEEWKKAVTAILWHDEVGAWLDYDTLNDIKRNYFYPTNISPLWTNCYDMAHKEEYVSKVLKYLEKSQIMIYSGGIPTTLEHTGEQWDYPNAWPPLQYIVIMALDNTKDAWAKRLAYEISQRWIRSNYKAFNETHSMYEKYDATVSGGHGDGGEYFVQLGFGWTNGVIMDLLQKYGDELTAEDHFIPEEQSTPSAAQQRLAMSPTGQVLTFLGCAMTFAAGIIG